MRESLSIFYFLYFIFYLCIFLYFLYFYIYNLYTVATRIRSVMYGIHLRMADRPKHVVK
jgi:hypothetical protein